MQAEEVKALIAQGLDSKEIEVQGEGDRFHVTVVSDQFAGMMPVKKQQMVYACLNDAISQGQIHAVTMSLFTPEQWADQNK